MLGLVLYTIFTSELPSPRSRNVVTATYEDDTTFLATSALRREAIDRHDMLNEFEAWASRWNIAVNTEKSQHATFSLNSLNTNRFTLDSPGLPTVISLCTACNTSIKIIESGQAKFIMFVHLSPRPQLATD